METQKPFVTGKDLKEKRTQFLHARCAESQYFGMSNVSDWLLEQKHLERPTDIEAWTRIIQCNANMVGSDVGKMSLPELLGGYGLCIDEVNLSKEELPSIDALQSVHNLVDNVIGELGDAYITDSGLLYLSPDCKQVMRFEGNERGGTYTTSILISDVLESARLSWCYSKQHHHAVTARALICWWLERRIQYVLNEAGKEFDKAVAVSKDGVKILHADKVVLYAVHHSGIDLFEYESSFFTKRKIVHGANIYRQQGLSKDFNPCTKELIEIIQKCSKGEQNENFLFVSVVVGFDPTRLFFHRVDNPPCFK
jgi:hypothetical protein